MLIEDYGFIGDTQTGALVGLDGAVDWLCLPRFDSASCLAALVGDERHGSWRLAPAGAFSASSRRYRPGTLVLETEFETADGAVRVIDFMPRRADGLPRLMRIVEGVRGRVPMRMELALRPDYGAITPWTERVSDGAIATSGPDAFRLSSPLELEVRDGTVTADFVVFEGARERLTLTWHASFEETPRVEDADSALARTETWWRSWSGRCAYLPGYEGSKPVRVGNAASEQFQLDVYGEVIGVAYRAAELLGGVDERLWPRWRTLIEYVESIWREPDDGIWESRGPRRHYTYSKVMAWVVFDRGVRLAERFGLDAPLERWKKVRDEIHREVCEGGYDAERRTFTQYYGSRELDASVLNIPLVGFLPGSDERVTGTIDAVSRELGRDGFVSRYSTAETDDGLPGGEGQFLACSFWLVNALALNGRVDEAHALFERLLGLANDLGLLAEEYDVERERQVGNFPQAFSHLTLIGAAYAIAAAETDAKQPNGGPVARPMEVTR